eukprot:3151376-Lingulodinium_polyedra.AAC.1
MLGRSRFTPRDLHTGSHGFNDDHNLVDRPNVEPCRPLDSMLDLQRSLSISIPVCHWPSINRCPHFNQTDAARMGGSFVISTATE